MKTNPSFRIFKLYTLVPLGIAIAAAIVTRPVSAVTVNNTLLITENSPTSLSATYNGSTLTVTSVAPEEWNVVFNPGGSSGSFFTRQWIEPEHSNLVNRVSPITFGSFMVVSDVTPIVPRLVKPVPDGTAVQIGTVDNVPIIATFDDDAAPKERVPDTGSTFALLLLSLIGLLGATRLRSAQSA